MDMEEVLASTSVQNWIELEQRFRNDGLCAPVRMKRRVLHLLQGAMYWSGGASLYTRVRRVEGAMILTYHSVPPPWLDCWIDPSNRILPDVFATQMRFLKHHRLVIGFSDLVDAISNRQPLNAGTVAITFDDGYRDTLEVAAPILAELGLPAIIFLPTGYITRGETQWIDRLYTIFRTRTRDSVRLETDKLRIDLRYPVGARRAFGEASGRLVQASWAEREALLVNLTEQLQPVVTPPRLTMNWDEMRTLVDRYPLFEIGVHTVDHLDVTQYGPDAIRAELQRCIEDVERELKRRPEHFSFPYSRCTEETCDIVRDCGLRSAVGDLPGQSLPVTHESNVFGLRRVSSPASHTMFRFLTSGAYPGLSVALTGRA